MSKTHRTTADSRTAIAYLRVSTDEQHLGPEAQRAAVVAWAARAGVTIAAWYEDKGVSGAAAIDKRPGLLAALDALPQHRAGLLVVANRSRLARDVVAAAMIERMAERVGARVTSAAGEGEGDDPASKLMRQIVDAFAEYERALIRGRTSAALQAKKARGERLGVAGGRNRIGGDSVSAERTATERAILDCVRELRAAGMTVRAIADELARLGHRTRKGGHIAPTQVARLCKAA